MDQVWGSNAAAFAVALHCSCTIGCSSISVGERPQVRGSPSLYLVAYQIAREMQQQVLRCGFVVGHHCFIHASVIRIWEFPVKGGLSTICESGNLPVGLWHCALSSSAIVAVRWWSQGSVHVKWGPWMELKHLHALCASVQPCTLISPYFSNHSDLSINRCYDFLRGKKRGCSYIVNLNIVLVFAC